MPIINANGIELYYEIHGEGEPLIMIAGYTGDHSFWRYMQEQLAQSFQVVILDNRGIGQTQDSGAPITLELIAQDIMALTEQLSLKTTHIMGQSMGGAVAQIIARNYASKIAKLVILNSATKLNLRTLKTLESLLNLRKANLAFDSFIDTAMPWFFSSEYLANPKNISTFKDQLIANPYPQSVADQERQFKALIPFDSNQWVHEIKAPTLIVAGEEDIIALPEESRDLANKIAHSNYVKIPGAHSSPIEHPQLLNQLIHQFLTS